MVMLQCVDSIIYVFQLLTTMVTYLVVLLQFQISLPDEKSADLEG